MALRFSGIFYGITEDRLEKLARHKDLKREYAKVAILAAMEKAEYESSVGGKAPLLGYAAAMQQFDNGDFDFRRISDITDLLNQLSILMETSEWKMRFEDRMWAYGYKRGLEEVFDLI